MRAKSKNVTKGPRKYPTHQTGQQNELTLRPALAVALLLVGATLAVYWGSLGHEFTIWDDDIYVAANPAVQAGLNTKSIAWAFNIGYAANWHPLTWLSHMADWQLFGPTPMGHHLTNIIFHIANVLLLFWILIRMTGAVWKSAFVAALFAIHPLHVESVAWVSERKDVLCTMFCFLAILAYFRYCEKRTVGRYVAVACAFALALMAKPMAVTLPIVLLLLDYWPLGRFKGTEKNESITSLILEKTPLFALSFASGVMTIIAQHKAGAIASVQNCPFPVRLGNVVLSYVNYLLKMVWPRDLVIDYPYAQSFPIWQIAAAALFLAGVTAWAIAARTRQRYLLTGWLWYLVTLLPVIGLLQVGDQSMADRYTYMPLIGVFIMISWGLSEAAHRWPVASKTLAASAIAVLLALGVSARSQVGYWRDSVTLFEHTLTVAPNSPIIQNDLGSALAARDRLDEAIQHCSEAIRLNPDYAKAHYNLAYCLQRQGDINGAVSHYEAAIRIDPGYAKAHNDLAVVYISMGRFDDVIDHCARALSTRPDYAAAHGNLAIAYFYKADYAKAWEEAQLCEKYGHRLPSNFIDDLASKLRKSGNNAQVGTP